MLNMAFLLLDGECLFNSLNLLDLSNNELEKIRGRKIAMIPQNAGQSLTPNLKIGYQIEEALKLHTNLNENERKDRISELLNNVRLPSPDVMAFSSTMTFSSTRKSTLRVPKLYSQSL